MHTVRNNLTNTVLHKHAANQNQTLISHRLTAKLFSHIRCRTHKTIQLLLLLSTMMPRRSITDY